jgi:hypothetical protein
VSHRSHRSAVRSCKTMSVHEERTYRCVCTMWIYFRFDLCNRYCSPVRGKEGRDRREIEESMRRWTDRQIDGAFHGLYRCVDSRIDTDKDADIEIDKDAGTDLEWECGVQGAI